MVGLLDSLTKVSQDGKNISEFMQSIKTIVDDLAMIGHEMSDGEIVVHTLNGLTDDYKEIKAALRARESPVSFEELLEKLLDYETSLKHNDPTKASTIVTAQYTQKNKRGKGRYHNNLQGQQGSTGGYGGNQGPRYQNQGSGYQYYQQNQGNRGNSSNPNTYSQSYSSNRTWQPNTHGGQPWPVCQLCDKVGHVAKLCRSRPSPNNLPWPQANFATHDTSGNQSDWVVDSRASHHITSDLQNLSIHSDYGGNDDVIVGNGKSIPITHIGSTTLSSNDSIFQLNNVLCAPKIKKNLLSVSQFCSQNNTSIEFFPDFFLVKDLTTGASLVRGQNKGHVYEWPNSKYQLGGSQNLALTATPSKSSPATVSTWHCRLGHPSSKILHKIIAAHQLPLSKTNTIFSHCNSCLCNKSHKLPFGISSLNCSKPLEIIFMDVWGSAPIISFNNFRYYVIFVDYFTKYTWLYPLKHKSDVVTVFAQFKTLVERYFNTTIQTLYTDRSGEATSLGHLLAQAGIQHLKSPPHTPEHVGTAERKHRHIVETALTLLHHASLPLKYWSLAFQTAVYLINRMPSPITHNQSPFFHLFRVSPNYSSLKTFGCLCYPWLRPYTSHKLEPRSRPCVFVGYSVDHHAYLCLDPTSNKLFTSRHVRFVENVFPFHSTNPSPQSTLSSTIADWFSPSPPTPVIHSPSASPPLQPEKAIEILPAASTPSLVQLTSPSHASLLSDASPRHTRPSTGSHTQNSTSSTATCSASPSEAVSSPLQVNHSPSISNFPSPLPASHPYNTRLRNNITKPKQILDLNTTTASSLFEPSTYKQAQKHSAWRHAMSDEFNALLANQTWTLVPRTPTQNVIGCKWVYRIKKNPDGSLARYKARLVAKGFHQRPGIDFSETYSPVVKPATIRLLLALAVTNSWPLRQLDVNNAFLQGSLSDEVFMDQPSGFEDATYPTHVCKLRKAIYGLRQAPRAWYYELRTFLLSEGFTNSHSDTSLFMLHSDASVIYLLVYVDDIIITGSSSSAVTAFISVLAGRFSLKDLGTLSYFLGVEAHFTTTGLFLSQQKYIRDLLQRVNMSDAKPVSTPLAVTASLQLSDGTPLADATLYCQVLGSLQYLSLTRPDVSFAVNKLSQFMHMPSTLHWSAVKRLLRYLAGTLDFGLLLRKGSSLNLHAFADADWAGDPNDRTSTTAYVVFLGSIPISWSSKKQKTVARSSTEAEYRAIASTAAEVNWSTNLLHELRVPLPSPPVIYCDNVGATYVCSNPVFHSRMKHIAIDFHFVRDQVATGRLRISHVHTSDQLADSLTKPLPRLHFHTHRSKIGVLNGQTILRGHVKPMENITP